MMRECAAGKQIGDYYVSRDRMTVYLEVVVPEDYRLNGVVEPLIHQYCAVLEDEYRSRGRCCEKNENWTTQVQN